jgi:phosphotransferase system HPr (HPr) family protein
MNGETLQRTVTITNPQGFHLRPMSAFAQTAARFPCSVRVSHGEKTVDGKSIFELMLLAAAQGAAVTVETQGPEAAAALDALVAVLEAPPPEDDPSEPSPPTAG